MGGAVAGVSRGHCAAHPSAQRTVSTRVQQMTSPCNADCSFCSKSYRDVGPLVEGPGDVYICGECVELCQAIIDQEKRRRLSRVENPRSWPDPEMVRATLDRIGGLSGDICEALIQGALDHCADAERTAGDMVV